MALDCRSRELNPNTDICKPVFQNRHRLPSVSSANAPALEIAMTSSRSHRIARIALGAAPMAVCLSFANLALASQGPGGGPGTASQLTQLAMAILVYGTSALLVGAGLIGAARRRLR
jgi:hypothetical protein